MNADELFTYLADAAERLGIPIHEEDLTSRQREEGPLLGLARGGYLLLERSLTGPQRAFVLAHELMHEILMHCYQQWTIPEREVREAQASWAAATACIAMGVNVHWILDAYGVPRREPDDSGEAAWGFQMLLAAMLGTESLPARPRDASWLSRWDRAASLSLSLAWIHQVPSRFNSFPVWHEGKGTTLNPVSAINTYPWYPTRRELLARASA